MLIMGRIMDLARCFVCLSVPYTTNSRFLTRKLTGAEKIHVL